MALCWWGICLILYFKTIRKFGRIAQKSPKEFETRDNKTILQLRNMSCSRGVNPDIQAGIERVQSVPEVIQSFIETLWGSVFIYNCTHGFAAVVIYAQSLGE